MAQIILTTAAGVILLAGLSFFLNWFGERSKQKARRRYEKKFQFIDKYMAEMETASEKQMELKRRERMAAFNQGQVRIEEGSLSGSPGEAIS